MKNTKEKTKEKSAPKFEWIGNIDGVPVFKISACKGLYVFGTPQIAIGPNSCPEYAKPVAERIAKRMRETFAEDGK